MKSKTQINGIDQDVRFVKFDTNLISVYQVFYNKK